MKRLDHLKTSPTESKNQIMDFLRRTSSKIFNILNDGEKVEKRFRGDFSTKLRDIKKGLKLLGFIEDKTTKHSGGELYEHKELNINKVTFCKSQKNEGSVSIGTFEASVLKIIGFTKKEFEAVLINA